MLLDVYWWMLWGSLAAAVISIFIGDLIESLFGGLDEFFNPLLLFGTLSVVGGAGVLLTKYTGLNMGAVLLMSALAGALAYVIIYYFLIIPLSNAEASTSISMQDLEGKMGEVITTIPAEGLGEVFIESPNGSRNETAKSFESEEIKQGSRIVVVQVAEQMVLVSKFEDELNWGE
ncbi:protease [Thalassobacillus sp. CUG 92003]|uniref:protease n=1 Tax=Thalassobacillus sp. CUG 92003 TaxID=2736641 RepID=UPI0015E6A755|nr:protease [Thalassobacillus sp. CUG 92003]